MVTAAELLAAAAAAVREDKCAQALIAPGMYVNH
jgi:hypothetical protein